MVKINKSEEFFKLSTFALAILAVIFAVVLFAVVSGDKCEKVSEDDKLNSTSLSENPVVVIETSKGNIELELYPEDAPITVENFLSYANEGFYDGLIFHRVIDGFMIQGGGFNAGGVQKETKAPIKLESDNGLSNSVGTIAMARTSVPNSATSQFFINVNDNTFLDYSASNDGYAVFGKVISGMDVVNEIKGVETGVKFGQKDWPVENIYIIKVYVKDGE